MELGLIGLGRMGGNMALRLIRGGHRVVVYDADKDSVARLAGAGCQATRSLGELVTALASPRIVWIMVPHGAPTEETVQQLTGVLSAGDILIDGGNSNYKDSLRRAQAVSAGGIGYLDVGTSGGVWGLENGYCMTIGGAKESFSLVEPIFQTLAPARNRGYLHVGSSGAGHFVKMVHNAIEYGLMEAYAEGFELLRAKTDFKFDLPAIAETWRHGSVVRSWLLDLGAASFNEDPELAVTAPYVEDSGEGRWAVEESVALAVPLPAITLALQVRFRSRQENPFGARLLAALRKQFGRHAVKKPR